MSIFMLSPINPFLFFSDNVLNVLFSFALGYAISSVFVLLKYLERGEVSDRYVVLRPIAGGAVSACIFVMVISGGNLIWQQVSGVNGLSVGVIAAIGSVYCERFERMLTKSLQKGEQHQKIEQPK
jgi:amino acid transporter